MMTQLLRAGKTLWFVLTVMVWVDASAAATDSTANSQPSIKDLGGNQYQVGQISIDKNKGQFRVPGKVIRTDPPLEFLAVVKGGPKAYESVLELDVNAYEFNLACILIGLDAEHATSIKFHFDPTPLEGDRVDMQIEWQQKGKTVSVPIADILNEGGKEPKHPASDWVYTGSSFLPNGNYVAQVIGVLIGFVHTPESVIDHRTGVGLGNYGAVATSDKVPPVGTPIVMVISKGED